ncbi:MAG TPA: SRPBCC family protein, partial [Trebonia sp.]
MTEDRVMRMLGWFSAGLGVPQVSTPGGFARAIGVGDGPRQRAATVFVGMREVAAAAGLLWRGNPMWLWGRVAGDLMDLSMLARALKNHDRKGTIRTIAAAAAVGGITGFDLYAAISRTGRKSMIDLTATTTITRPRQEVYDQWRHLDRLPTFMTHVDSVSMTGQRTSHWRASAPFGRTVEWDAEITEDVPGERIAWRSINGGLVRSEGEVRFTAAPTGKDTEVSVRMRYSMPAGKAGESVARYFGE